MSPIFDMLTISIIFELFNTIGNALATGMVPSKKMWADLVWTKAWRMEDKLWASNGILNGDSIFRSVCGTSHYISWWSLCDVKPHLRRMWEVMVKLICSSSRLKSDDILLKGSHDSLKFCSNCDLGIVESVRHIVMQCPFNIMEITDMYSEPDKLEDGSWEYAKECGDLMSVILGCELPNLGAEQCFTIWEITGKAVFSIYQKIINQRAGVG